MSRVFQPNFSGGILGEGAYSRSDLTKYSIGLKDAVNMVIRQQGGASNRAGFGTVTGFDTSTVNATNAKQRPIPFAFSTEQEYILEFGHQIARVIRNGAYILDTVFGSKGITSFTASATAGVVMDSVPEAAAFTAGDMVYLSNSTSHALEGVVLEVGSVVSDTVNLIAYDGDALDAATGAWGTMGASATLQKVYSLATPYDIEDLGTVNFAQDADTMYMVHPSYAVRKLVRTADDSWAISTVTFAPSVSAVDEDTGTITGITQANPAVVSITGHNLSNGDGFGITGVVGMTQVNDRVFIARNVTANTFELEDRDGTAVDSTGYTIYGSAGTMTTPAAELEGSGTTTYTYVVAPLDADTLEEGLPTSEFTIDNDLTTTGNMNHLAWKAQSAAGRYLIYKQSAGALGYIGSTTSTQFIDENITPDTSDGPQIGRNPFPSTDNYPSAVDMHEQRLVLMSTNNDPQLVEGSKTANLENFNQAYPLKDDDAYRFRLKARRVNKILSSVSSDALMLFTSGGEWAVTGIDNVGFISPKSGIAPRRQTGYGSASLTPLEVGQAILFTQGTGDIIRDFRPFTDTPPADLTILSRDLFNGRTIVSWTYAQSPDSIVWAALDNGILLSMTYVPEHDIWAWTRHEIGGAVGDVTYFYAVDPASTVAGLGGSGGIVHYVQSIREFGRDVLYATIERKLFGDKQVTMLERMEQRADDTPQNAMYLDASLSQTFGSDTSVVSGLLHLRGQTVSVVADGDVYADQTVDNAGTVDLGDAFGQQIHIGLPYYGVMETLPVDLGNIDGFGSTQGGHKAASAVNVVFEKSRGLAVGTSIDRLNEVKEWDATLVDGPLPLKTGIEDVAIEGDWERIGTVFVVQPHPMPLTVTGVVPDWEVSS